jgi:hypothetical protein
LIQSDYGRFSILAKSPAVGVPTWNMRPLDSKAPLLTIAFDRPVPEVEMGSTGTGLVGIEGIGPRPDPRNFWAIADLATFLRAGVRGAIERVATVAGL